MKTTYDKCSDCSICIENCPAGSILREVDKIIFDETRCIHCNMCVEACSNILDEQSESYRCKTSEALTIGIIGCGVAGIRSANELRLRGHKVTILTKERLPVDRPNLCDYFLKKGTNLNDVIDGGVEIVKNTSITDISEQNGIVTVTTNNGVFHFERLIIAAGAKATDHLNCSQMENVFSFWEYDSVKKLVDYVKQNNAESAIIIGGGSVGIEAAFFLSEMGCSVTLIEKTGHLLAGRMDPLIFTAILEEMKKRSITCVFNKNVTEICPEGVYVDNQLYKSTIIVTTGSRPDVDCFRTSGLMINNGIIVNEKMETNISHIYAAGDIAECNSTTSATVKNALRQASVAVHNICGNQKLFKEEPVCEILKNIPLSVVVSGEKKGERIVKKSGDTIRIVYRDGNNRVNGYQSVNDTGGMSGILYNAMKRNVEVSDDVIFHEHSIFTIKKESFNERGSK